MEEFKVNSTYKQPTGTNGLDRWRGVQPLQGWGSSVLQSIFLNGTIDTPTVTTPTVTTPTVTPPTDTPSQSKTEPFFIIGASVGGFIGLILTGAFIYWCFWVYVPMRQKREGTQRRNGGISSGSVPASIAGQSGWSKPELEAGTDSGSSTRPPTRPPIIYELDHSIQDSPSPGTKIQDPNGIVVK